MSIFILVGNSAILNVWLHWSFLTDEIFQRQDHDKNINITILKVSI